MNSGFIDLWKPDILLVDDTPDNLRLLTSMLTKRGYKIRKAINGQMALTSCQIVQPDLILLDIMMPDLDGYEVCRRLKANEKTCQIPVIFISALSETLDKVKAFGAGGVDYITKPFDVEEVLARVANQLTIQNLQRQLREQNQRLQELNQELMRSNEELEQFAYVASHDLQSPLQIIIGYADMLGWKYDSLIDEEADRYINEIVGAGMRMKNLIQDLLDYSRVGKKIANFEPVKCDVIVQEALANLANEIAASGAVINCDSLPTVMGDATQLMQLFQNLIGNSIKFRQPQVNPLIRILAQGGNEDEWVISVEDNGIGIEAENFGLIFQVFQRLHSFEEYPGTGIGMSICKKIVERHGGRIWVESELGTGTIVYFSLPRA